MVDFAALRATAKRLIDENGRDVTLTKQSNTVVDATQPWVVAEPAATTTVTGKGVFVADKVREGLVWSFARSVMDSLDTDRAVCLFAAANDGGNDLEEFDQLTVGTKTYRILRVELLQPATDRILYAFEVAQ